MKFWVSRRTLILLAGIIWTIAGANILNIGIDCWRQYEVGFPLKALGAAVVFTAFYIGVFSRMYNKHIKRISLKGDDNCPFSFFDAKGWLIMAFMITLGITIRHFALMPVWFIAMFYTGLSSSLIVTGLRFLFALRKA